MVSAGESVTAESATSQRQWFIVGRWQEYEGEGRANLLRIVAIGAFYVVQLIHFYLLTNAADRDITFHNQATALVVVWSLVSLVILLCLRQRIFPAYLKFVSTGCDIVLLTSLAMIGSCAESPLVFVYFLVIVLAGLRFSLRLIWCATLGSMAGYMVLVGLSDDSWFDTDHTIPIIQQLVVLLSLGLTGIMLGQIVRRVKALAVEYARRIGAIEKEGA